MMLKQAFQNVLKPYIEKIAAVINSKSTEWKEISLLARTHGQPASPTKMGKEWFVFYERIQNQLELLEQIPFCGKFGGATGNFNAHFVAYPNIDWQKFANRFLLEKLSLKRLQTTTQIEHYDHFSAFCDNIKRINTILIDFCRDIWTYISMDYFKQKIKDGEVGSSAMPHKVNPIDFENAEGNLGIANTVFEHFSAKLPVSRLQRDLSDSTVMRNMGVPMAHTFIALLSIDKGIGKLLINQEKTNRDLENNWAVVAEAIQTILRRENYPNPYEALKSLTRTNKTIDKAGIQNFISSLDVSEDIKEEMRKIKPENYTGVFYI